MNRINITWCVSQCHDVWEFACGRPSAARHGTRQESAERRAGNCLSAGGADRLQTAVRVEAGLGRGRGGHHAGRCRPGRRGRGDAAPQRAARRRRGLGRQNRLRATGPGLAPTQARPDCGRRGWMWCQMFVLHHAVLRMYVNVKSILGDFDYFRIFKTNVFSTFGCVQSV